MISSEAEQEDNEDEHDADNDEAEPEEEGGKNGHKASSDEEESSECDFIGFVTNGKYLSFDILRHIISSKCLATIEEPPF